MLYGVTYASEIHNVVLNFHQLRSAFFVGRMTTRYVSVEIAGFRCTAVHDNGRTGSRIEKCRPQCVEIDPYRIC